MSDPYERAIGERLVYKSGSIATLKTIDKNKHKKKKKKTKNEKSKQSLSDEEQNQSEEAGGSAVLSGEAAGEVYTIDAAKRMKYDELFPVEARKFGYDPKSKSKSVEDALDDRVTKKADRYCK